MAREKWNGSKLTKLIATIVRRDHGICWLCHHPGANSIDHVLTVESRPDLEWDTTNMRAAHHHKAGHPRGCAVNGCTCPGNTGRGRKPAAPPPSRTW